MSLVQGSGISGSNKGRQYFGITVGVVTNNKDPEGLGRVKIMLPDRLGDGETNWARISVPMAGKGMGTFILPEVGDEVLVAFREGSIREPYVLGSLWNMDGKPPKDNDDGKNNFRVFKSRAGHEIIIDDTGDAGGIEIKTKAGASIKINNEGETKITVKDKSGNNKVEIDGSANTVSVKGSNKVSVVSGENSVNLDGTQNSVAIKGAMKISLQASMIEIKADAALDLKCDGMVTLKGAMVQIN